MRIEREGERNSNNNGFVNIVVGKGKGYFGAVHDHIRGVFLIEIYC